TSPVPQRSFLERNISWIAAAAALFVIAFLFDRFGQRPHEPHAATRPPGEAMAQASPLLQPDDASASRREPDQGAVAHSAPSASQSGASKSGAPGTDGKPAP